MQLSLEITPQLVDYLKVKKLLPGNETVTEVEKPGSGNMNFVMRVKTSGGKTFILKQARPWVEKYPQVAAPVERTEMEAKFYKAIRKDEFLETMMPKLLMADAKNHILALEDLGTARDYTWAYQKGRQLSEHECKNVGVFLFLLHELPKPRFPANMAMRTLNHEHIFNYPFLENNGFDLDNVLPGLQAVSMKYKKDEPLKKRIRDLGKTYLSRRGGVLLHGDIYPGSWVMAPAGITMIDPEFAFVGPREFDLGVYLAHMKMARQWDNGPGAHALGFYGERLGYDEKLLHAFAGAEILRRILGLAQLPLDLNLDERQALLEEAKSWLL